MVIIDYNMLLISTMMLIFRYILDTISFTKNNKKTTQSKLLDNLNKIVNTPNILLTDRNSTNKYSKYKFAMGLFNDIL